MTHADGEQPAEEMGPDGGSRWTDANPPTAAVIEAVARRDGVDPTDLAPLYDAVDPEALDDLFCHPPGWTNGTDVRATFHYAGYEVTVGADGRLTVSQVTDSD